MKTKITHHFTPVLTMPEDLRKKVLLEINNPSPYNRYTSGSFYDCNDKNWDYTPDGSLRVSDHWNFYSRGSIHCVTDVANEALTDKWTIARYDAKREVYVVLSTFDKDHTALIKREQRAENKYVPVDEDSLRQKRLDRVEYLKNQKRAADRANKIRNGLLANKATKIWVEVNVNVWSGTGRRVKFAGTKTLFGCLTWESKTGNSFCIRLSTGEVKEIRKCNSYKEFNRKPRS